MNSCSMFRDRMLADPSFLFKVGTEVCFGVIKIQYKPTIHNSHNSFALLANALIFTYIAYYGIFNRFRVYFATKNHIIYI